MYQIKLISLADLKAHEKTDFQRTKSVRKMLKRTGYFSQPILVDRKTKIILDGHHRSQILALLGLKKIPALMVNYRSPRIKVLSRRKGLKINKGVVLHKAENGELFPCKTTKHLISWRLPKISVPFEKLK